MLAIRRLRRASLMRYISSGTPLGPTPNSIDDQIVYALPFSGDFNKASERVAKIHDRRITDAGNQDISKLKWSLETVYWPVWVLDVLVTGQSRHGDGLITEWHAKNLVYPGNDAPLRRLALEVNLAEISQPSELTSPATPSILGNPSRKVYPFNLSHRGLALWVEERSSNLDLPLVPGTVKLEGLHAYPIYVPLYLLSYENQGSTGTYAVRGDLQVLADCYHLDDGASPVFSWRDGHSGFENTAEVDVRHRSFSYSRLKDAYAAPHTMKRFSGLVPFLATQVRKEEKGVSEVEPLSRIVGGFLRMIGEAGKSKTRRKWSEEQADENTPPNENGRNIIRAVVEPLTDDNSKSLAANEASAILDWLHPHIGSRTFQQSAIDWLHPTICELKDLAKHRQWLDLQSEISILKRFAEFSRKVEAMAIKEPAISEALIRVFKHLLKSESGSLEKYTKPRMSILVEQHIIVRRELQKQALLGGVNGILGAYAAFAKRIMDKVKEKREKGE